MSKQIKEKEYRLADSRSGEAFILKTGRNKRLLFFDEDKGFNRAIRHCPNESKIFIDEQSEHALVEPIVFVHGMLTVPRTAQLTQTFLDNHPDNVLNGGNIFEEIDDAKEAEEDIERDELVVSIKQAIREEAKGENGDYSLEMVAANLEGSLERVSKMSTSELKRLIYNHVDDNPYYFVDDDMEVSIFDDEKMQTKYIILRAVKDGILKKSPNNKSIMWAHSNTTIVTAPQGVGLIDYFAEYLGTDDGILVLEEIRKRS